MAVHDGSVAACEHRNLESKLADAAAHAIHCGVVLAWVAGVENKPVNVPNLNLWDLRRRLRKHASPSDTSKVEEPFGGCALRWPVEPSLWFFYTRFQRFCKSDYKTIGQLRFIQPQ